MKISGWSLALFTILFFIVGIFVGYGFGYQEGAKAVINYATEFVDKVKIESFNIEVNNKKVDEILSNFENITNEMNRRLNNISIYP